MNERIKKLAEQAWVYQVRVLNEPDGSRIYTEKEKVFDKEKFAELIVKEMLQTCEDHPAWTGRMIGEHIKQHFGVEE